MILLNSSGVKIAGTKIEVPEAASTARTRKLVGLILRWDKGTGYWTKKKQKEHGLKRFIVEGSKFDRDMKFEATLRHEVMHKHRVRGDQRI